MQWGNLDSVAGIHCYWYCVAVPRPCRGTESPEEVEGVLEGLSTAAPLQAMHTVLRQHNTVPSVQIAGYQAIRNLVALPVQPVTDTRWADKVGNVFIGHLISLFRTMEDVPKCQEVFGAFKVVPSRFSVVTRRDLISLLVDLEVRARE